jgi:uncharacterized integral membrane protein
MVQEIKVAPVITDTTNLAHDRRSRVGTTWVMLSAFVIILLLLLIFILQNSKSIKIHYLGLAGNIGFGVAMLLSAVVGSIMTLLVGSVRILQLKLSNKHRREAA